MPDLRIGRMLLEKRFLQAALLVVALIPITAGLSGVLNGPSFFDVSAGVSADSHMRYLSGLLLGIGVQALTIVPHVERHAGRMGALTLIVFVGGISRLYSLAVVGGPDITMTLALFVELLITPALFVWVRRVSRFNLETQRSGAPPDPGLVHRQ